MDRDFLNQIDSLGDLIPHPENEKLDDEILLCECFCVSVRDVRELFAESQDVDLHTLQARFDLGKGCQSCLKNLDSWINKIF